MDTRYPEAHWRPLSSNNTEPKIGKPSVLIFHTMVGYLAGTDSMFHNDGYGGTESHFGVGGKHDGTNDGIVYQWQTIDRQADAQYSGNAYATSIETSDGGHPTEPWSEKQIAALVRLGVWWCKTTKNPARLVHSPTDVGFGYHQQFNEWNRSNHNCPGSVRVGQLKTMVIPWVQSILIGELDVATAKDVDVLFTTDGVLKAPPSRATKDNPYWQAWSGIVETYEKVHKIETELAAQGELLRKIAEHLDIQ